ncbi:3-oxoacyl-[acyl-carrier-protein] reductase FabG-like [Manduca sexta]|uniref:3-oxoacyl-[acyl-carrier-protein] reductase FabG-like n=1 Tax=Manduca sexta TaxID=7130 RepID=UPI0018908F3C|nr:3-oxoacyl-[acyl-carrier-protein] reductase FabG-like [Manduca sexta]
MSFSGKVVMMTGGSSGIGAATALAFGREGARVAIVGRNQAKLASVAATFTGLPQPLIIAADIADNNQASTIIQRTIKEFGKLDVLVNNAGMSHNGSILEGNLMAAYDNVMATNLRAPIHLTTLAAPHLIKAKGNIINVSSILGLTTTPMHVLMAYSISKAALNQFSKAAALELAPHGVRVNIISPGPVKTEILETNNFPGTWDDFQKLTALNRVAKVEEIADLMLFLASDKAKSVTGANYVSDNGMLLRV